MKKENLNIDQETRLSNYEILGGIDGLCMAVKFHRVQPDSKFFNTLLLVRKFLNLKKTIKTYSKFKFFKKICPNNIESEEKLIAQMNHFNVKPTIDICNFLIKRRLHFTRRENENADVNTCFYM
jgi:hypothetical protein